MDNNIADFKIGVIIPVYNASNTIVNTIQSVLNQKYPVTEIILINDGSTDDSVQLIHSNFNKLIEERVIIIIDKINEGPARARNIGASESKCDWIAFLDADDSWMQEKLFIQVSCLRDNPEIGMVGTASNISSFKSNENLIEVSYSNLLFKNYFATSSVLLSKSLFLSCGGFDEKMRYSEDFNLWLSILYVAKGSVINQSLLAYSTNGDSRLSKQSKNMYKGEVWNYKQQYAKGRINFAVSKFLILFSYLKYLKRIW